MKHFKKIVGRMAVTAGLFAMSAAHADSIGDIAKAGTTQASGLLLFLQALAAIVGVVFIIGGFMSVRAANKTEGQAVKYSVGIVTVFVGAALFYLASVIETGGDTIWQGGGSRSQLQITQ